MQAGAFPETFTEAAAQMLRKMEKHGVVQPPRVYAEGPSIIAFN